MVEPEVEQQTEHVGVEIWQEPARGAYFNPLLSALSSDEREKAFHNGQWLLAGWVSPRGAWNWHPATISTSA